jgi:hypothetical protein
MPHRDLPPDRRHFIRLALGLSTSLLLSGCGGSDGVAAATGANASPAVAAETAPVTPAAQGSHPLNLALNLSYLGAQFYSIAARGTGLATSSIGGIGRAGAASGARQISFADPLLAGHAAELADDKQAHVTALRAQIGTLAAAQPMLDLSTSATGAFSIAAQRAGIVAAGSSFDAYAGDDDFLLAAFLIENMVAASYRTLLAAGVDDGGVVSANLADAIYHGGLIRSLLDDRAVADPAIGTALSGASAMFAALDGTNVGDQTLAGASGSSANLLDADDRPIPFTRAQAQVLKTLYLSGGEVGGFLPQGANGIA